MSLQQGIVKCPIGGIYHLLATVGSLCFTGLCKKQPLRGSVDISWGVELHPGEIYGAAVANTYELESEIAQYPRIVIGERVVDYLNANLKTPQPDIYNEFNRSLAKLSFVQFVNNVPIQWHQSVLMSFSPADMDPFHAGIDIADLNG